MSAFSPFAMKQVSTERKAFYYVGMALTTIGLLLFFSTFVTFAIHFGDFGHGLLFHSGQMFMRAIVGMALIIIGGLLRTVGSRGMAGSGLLFDPDRARQDLEPWARMGGGMAKDAIDEMENSPHGSDMPFDEKLRRLESLRKDGLITDAEYQAKRSEILNSKL